VFCLFSGESLFGALKIVCRKEVWLIEQDSQIKTILEKLLHFQQKACQELFFRKRKKQFLFAMGSFKIQINCHKISHFFRL
jgi:hypothetical protein